MAFIHYKILHVNTIDSNNLLSVELSSFLLFKKERKEFVTPYLNIKKKKKSWKLGDLQKSRSSMMPCLYVSTNLETWKRCLIIFFHRFFSPPKQIMVFHSLAWTITFHSKEISQYSLIRHDINNHENTHAHI